MNINMKGTNVGRDLNAGNNNTNTNTSNSPPWLIYGLVALVVSGLIAGLVIFVLQERPDPLPEPEPIQLSVETPREEKARRVYDRVYKEFKKRLDAGEHVYPALEASAAYKSYLENH